MDNRNQNNTNNINKTTNAWNVIKSKSPQKSANNDNKRTHSSSSNSEPSSPKLLQHVSKKLFVTRNRFELLKPTEPAEETIVKEKQIIADPVPTYSKPPPPIFMRGVVDFPGVCTELVELLVLITLFVNQRLII